MTRLCGIKGGTMAKCYDEITPDLAEWIGQQRMFFVATAPLAAEGLINCSPKGLDTLRILGPKEVAYMDLTGSGIETVAHVRENGRIVLMLCSQLRKRERGVPGQSSSGASARAMASAGACPARVARMAGA